MTDLLLRTLGHASVALYREGGDPILVTDPWLVGSVYWRSWWLQHYPSADDIAWLGRAAHVYVTHEHPDHFHMPSIRRLGCCPTYLFPALAERGFLRHMEQAGFRAATVPARRWQPLGGGVAILSLPLWNDDSVLVIDTPDALILNLNDAKPLPPVLNSLRRLAERIPKRRVLLCSYSPASLVNSFLDDNGVVSLKEPQDYVAYVSRLCDRLGADLYLPFASQATFERPESTWANNCRTSFADLERGWTARARLLPPYTVLDLATGAHRSVSEKDYRPAAAATLGARTGERVAEESAAAITSDDVARLQRRLNRWRWLWHALFPRGFSFRLGEARLFYMPRTGRIEAAGPGQTGDFEIAVPPLTMVEALRNGHLSDLGITMVVRIRLFRRLDPRKVYGMFVLFQFDDYGHLAGVGALLRWIAGGLNASLPRRLPAP